MISAGRHSVQPFCFIDKETEVLSGAGACPKSCSKLADSRTRTRSPNTLIISTIKILNINVLDQEIRKGGLIIINPKLTWNKLLVKHQEDWSSSEVPLRLERVPLCGHPCAHTHCVKQCVMVWWNSVWWSPLHLDQVQFFFLRVNRQKKPFALEAHPDSDRDAPG